MTAARMIGPTVAFGLSTDRQAFIRADSPAPVARSTRRPTVVFASSACVCVMFFSVGGGEREKATQKALFQF